MDERNSLFKALAECYDQMSAISARENGIDYGSIPKDRRDNTLREIFFDVESYIRFRCKMDCIKEKDRMKVDEEVEML